MGSAPSKQTATVTPEVTNGQHSTTVPGSKYEGAQELIHKENELLRQQITKLELALTAPVAQSDSVQPAAEEVRRLQMELTEQRKSHEKQIENIRIEYERRIQEEVAKASTRFETELLEYKQHLNEATEREAKLNAAVEELTAEIVATQQLHDAATKSHIHTGLSAVHRKLQAVAALAPRAASECGVSLAWLTNFAKDIDPTWTTAEVVQKMVIPNTLDTKGRYTEKLAPHQYSTPTFFISHRWTDRFVDLVNTVASHCQSSGLGDTSKIFLWLDVFAVNQHAGAAQAKDLKNLGAAITKSARGTLLIMDDRGGVLTRIWCLFEMHLTIQQRTEGELIMLMPKNVDAGVMKEVWAELDVEKAEATVNADRDRILEQIRQSEVDAQQLSHTLKRSLVRGAVLQVDAARKGLRLVEGQGKDQEDAARLVLFSALLRAGQMTQSSGSATEARPLMTEAIETCKLLPHQESKEQQLRLATCENELAYLLCSGLYLYSESLPLCEKALATRRGLLGPVHYHIGLSLDMLGWILYNLERHSEAEKCYIEAIKIQQELFPGVDGHLQTAECLTNLGIILKATNRLDDALEKQYLALEMREKLKGRSHPLFAQSLMNTSQLLLKMGKPEEGLKLAKESLAVRLRSQGLNHPDCAHTHMTVSSTLVELKQFDEAATHALRAIEIRRLNAPPKSLAIALIHGGFVAEKCHQYRDGLKFVQEAIRVCAGHADADDIGKRAEEWKTHFVRLIG